MLIIEDTVELAEIIQMTLERLNLRVFHETHGSRALEIYDAEHARSGSAGYWPAGYDGLAGVAGDPIQTAFKGKRPLILVITAYGDPANRLMGKLQDIHGYLIKPLEPDEIEKAVMKVLDLKKPESDPVRPELMRGAAISSG